jgi:hypothetical protein
LSQSAPLPPKREEAPLLRINRAVVLFILLVAPLPIFAQTEAGFMVSGVVSSQPDGIAIIAVTCPVTGCPPGVANPIATHVNAGAAYEGFLAHRVVGFRAASLSVELPVLGIPNRGTNLNNVSFSTVAVTPGLRLSFVPHQSVSPFLSAGGGIVHFSGDTSSVTHGAARFGGGIDFKTPLPHLGARFEVKDLITPWPSLFPKSGVMQNLLFGGGVVFKF